MSLHHPFDASNPDLPCTACGGKVSPTTRRMNLGLCAACWRALPPVPPHEPAPTDADWADLMTRLDAHDGWPDEPPEMPDSTWFDPATDFEPTEAESAWWAAQQP